MTRIGHGRNGRRRGDGEGEGGKVKKGGEERVGGKVNRK